MSNTFIDGQDQVEKGINDVDTKVSSGTGTSGTIYYVSTGGSDSNTGLSWDNALLSIDAAINKCSAGDIVYIEAGTYNESANGASGVICDVNQVRIIGVQPGVVVTNTNTTNGGSVFTITGDQVVLENLSVMKGETTSNNSVLVKFNSSDGTNGTSVEITIVYED